MLLLLVVVVIAVVCVVVITFLGVANTKGSSTKRQKSTKNDVMQYLLQLFAHTVHVYCESGVV